MDIIKDIIPTVIGKMASQSPDQKKDINALWSRMAGLEGSRIVNLKSGTVTVHVDSALRMVKLNGRKEAFIEELQRIFPDVKWIHFKVGKI
jgi:hypothetical protein